MLRSRPTRSSPVPPHPARDSRPIWAWQPALRPSSVWASTQAPDETGRPSLSSVDLHLNNTTINNCNRPTTMTSLVGTRGRKSRSRSSESRERGPEAFSSRRPRLLPRVSTPRLIIILGHPRFVNPGHFLQTTLPHIMSVQTLTAHPEGDRLLLVLVVFRVLPELSPAATGGSSWNPMVSYRNVVGCTPGRPWSSKTCTVILTGTETS